MIYLINEADIIDIFETRKEAIGYIKGAKLDFKKLTLLEGEATTLTKCQECGKIITTDEAISTRGKTLCEKCCEV